MIIKEGYNGKELRIRINGRRNEKKAEIWLIQEGLPDESDRYRETLSYISLDELLELKQEIESAINAMFGIQS